MDERDDAAVTTHYAGAGAGAILERIDAALLDAGIDPATAGPDVLGGVDEFHLGGRAASEAVAAGLGLVQGSHVVDVGCGIGGVARTLASGHGCTVVGVDLTPAFVEVATTLSRRAGLADVTRFVVGDALAPPADGAVADADADAVTLFHVGMNVADKDALAAALARTVRPGGAVAVYDVMLLATPGELSWPQPWAGGPATSHLATADTYVTALRGAGLAVEAVTDRTDLVRTVLASSSPPPVGLGALMGPSFPVAFGNLLEALRAGLVAPTEVLARRP